MAVVQEMLLKRCLAIRRLLLKYFKICSFGFMILLVFASGFTYAGTELEDYVFSSDNTFEYRLVNTEQRLFYTTYVLEITSQTWREGEVYPEAWNTGLQ